MGEAASVNPFENFGPEEAAQAVRDTNLTRGITGIGMMFMLYDHVLTFGDEVELVWKARPTFGKRLFIFNRYSTVVMQLSIAVVINHFSDDSLSKTTCQAAITLACVLGTLSIACANVLIVLRVIVLWDRSNKIIIAMGVLFLASVCTSFTLMIIILKEAFDGIEYIPFIHACGATIDSTKLRGVWTSMLAFELLVLASVILNSLSRPRDTDTPLRRVLCRDGIIFFGSIAGLQLLNLLLSLSPQQSLHTTGIFFVWAITNLILNRALLNMLKATINPRSRSFSLCKDDAAASCKHERQFSVSKTSIQSRMHSVHSTRTGHNSVVCPQDMDMDILDSSFPPELSVGLETGTSGDDAANSDLDPLWHGAGYEARRSHSQRSLPSVPLETEYVERVAANKRIHEYDQEYVSDVERGPRRLVKGGRRPASGRGHKRGQVPNPNPNSRSRRPSAVAPVGDTAANEIELKNQLNRFDPHTAR